MSLRFLVVEDDPASREFVRASLADAATVDAVRTLADAGECCATHAYQLLLLDVALPDGEGDAWLARQRALGNRAPAIALTAELSPSRRQRLIGSGFVEALGKPLGEETLRRAVAACLGADASAWDDARALRALGGSEATLARMRRLFLDELPRQRARIRDAVSSGDADALRAELHQLRAGCGFVGATALAADVDALHRAPESPALADALLRRIDETVGSAAA